MLCLQGSLHTVHLMIDKEEQELMLDPEALVMILVYL